MIPGLPSPWILLGFALMLAGAYIGGNTHGHKAERVTWEAATAKLKADAAQTLADETAKVLAGARREAALNTQLESDHNEADKKIAAADVKLTDDRARWMREHPGCRQSSPAAGGANSGAGHTAQPTAGSVEELPAGSGQFIQSCATAAMKLETWAVACHAKLNSISCQP